MLKSGIHFFVLFVRKETYALLKADVSLRGKHTKTVKAKGTTQRSPLSTFMDVLVMTLNVYRSKKVFGR